MADRLKRCGDVYGDARCWVLTDAGMNLVNPVRLVPASAATRAVVARVLERDRRRV